MPTQDTEQQIVIRRALSMWQPFASLLVAGIKTLESRGFDTIFRGEFYVHATQSIPKEVYTDWYIADEEFRKIVNRFLQVEENSTLEWAVFRRSFTTGAIIGKATLKDSGPSWDFKERWENARRLADWEREWALGDHGSDRFAWEVENPVQFEHYVTIKGNQSILWKIDPSVKIFEAPKNATA